mmetsp:Transcript_25246/g.77834  ORF Transcript_25246/g.77834 Transcript_25246/m.77834 type:complete len:238 (+) Transcript_25246:209-922(+)
MMMMVRPPKEERSLGGGGGREGGRDGGDGGRAMHLPAVLGEDGGADGGDAEGGLEGEGLGGAGDVVVWVADLELGAEARDAGESESRGGGFDGTQFDEGKFLIRRDPGTHDDFRDARRHGAARLQSFIQKSAQLLRIEGRRQVADVEPSLFARGRVRRHLRRRRVLHPPEPVPELARLLRPLLLLSFSAGARLRHLPSHRGRRRPRQGPRPLSSVTTRVVVVALAVAPPRRRRPGAS